MINAYFTTRKIAQALATSLKDATLNQCFSTSTQEFVAEFVGKHDIYWLKISITKTCALCSLQVRNGELPKKRLAQFVELNDMQVLHVEAHFMERSFAIHFSNELSLIFKLYGGASNIILLKNGQATQAFKQNRSNDLERKTANFTPDKKIDFDIFSQISCIFELKKQLPFLNNGLIIKYLENANFDNLETQEEKTILLENLSEYLANPVFYINKTTEGYEFTLLETEETAQTNLLETEDALEATAFFARKYLTENRFSEAQTEQKKQIDPQIIKAQKAIENIDLAIAQLQAAVPKRHIADIIMANLGNIKMGEESVVLPNFYADNQPIKIGLKRDESPQKNAERYYQKGKKSHLELLNLEKKRLDAQEKLVVLNAQLQEVAQATNDKQLKIKQKIQPTTQELNLPYRLFEHKGTQIWVGKSAESNDEILRLAHKNDTWLHARGVAGSHVLVRHAAKPLEKATLQIAADLAAYYSKGKTQAMCPVIYTPRKFVRKPKGAAAGAVLLEKESVIMATPKLPNP